MENYVVTISRVFGSGGRTIGKMLSEKLSIPYYDKDIIKLASEESGINEALFGQVDEKLKNKFFSTVKAYNGQLATPDSPDFVSEENIFSYQAKIIKELAEKASPCIIIGRCADHILSDRKNVLKVFIWADNDCCIQNAMDICGYDRREAEKQVDKINRERAAYHKAHTGTDWMDVRNYDICLNSSQLGFEKCLDIITHYINIMK